MRTAASAGTPGLDPEFPTFLKLGRQPRAFKRPCRSRMAKGENSTRTQQFRESTEQPSLFPIVTERGVSRANLS
jgi:hypothetical protein